MRSYNFFVFNWSASPKTEKDGADDFSGRRTTAAYWDSTISIRQVLNFYLRVKGWSLKGGGVKKTLSL